MRDPSTIEHNTELIPIVKSILQSLSFKTPVENRIRRFFNKVRESDEDNELSNIIGFLYYDKKRDCVEFKTYFSNLRNPYSTDTWEGVLEALETSSAKSKMMSSLRKYLSYPEGWDGEDAVPLSEMVYNNCVSVIDAIPDTVAGKWKISPNVNGTAFLRGIGADAMINLGSKTFSYYIKENGKVSAFSNAEPFSVESITNVLKMI